MSKTERHVGALNRAHITTASAARNFWCVTPAAEVLPADLCEPSYWKHVVRELGLKPNDRVEATCQDGTWWAEYLVIHIGPQHAKLSILREVELDIVDESASSTETMYAEWISPANKYGVRRKSDKAIMKDGFTAKSLAVRWMHDNMQGMAA